jgi:hypothetical protein
MARELVQGRVSAKVLALVRQREQELVPGLVRVSTLAQELGLVAAQVPVKVLALSG